MNEEKHETVNDLRFILDYMSEQVWSEVMGDKLLLAELENEVRHQKSYSHLLESLGLTAKSNM